MFGSLPAFHAITASTANSGIVWIRARIARARPCDIRNSAASAPQATTNAAPIIAGNVQSVAHGEPAAACSAAPASSSRALPNFIARGYSMGLDAGDRERIEPPHPRDRAQPRDERRTSSWRARRRFSTRSPPACGSTTSCTTRASGPGGSPRSPPRIRGSCRARSSSTSPTRRRLSTCWRWRAAATFPWRRSWAATARSSSSSGSRTRATSARSSAWREAAGAAGVLGAPGTADFFHPARGARQRRKRAADPGLGPRLLRALRRRREGRGPRDLRRGRGRRRERVRGAALEARPCWRSARRGRVSRRAPTATSTAGSRSRCAPPSSRSTPPSPSALLLYSPGLRG